MIRFQIWLKQTKMGRKHFLAVLKFCPGTTYNFNYNVHKRTNYCWVMLHSDMRIGQENNTHYTMYYTCLVHSCFGNIVMTIIYASSSRIVMLSGLSSNFFKSSCHSYLLLMNVKRGNLIVFPLIFNTEINVMLN